MMLSKMTSDIHKTIRLAESLDMSAIMQVIDAAKQIMRASGNWHQWINGYPSEAVISADKEKHMGYVIEDAGRVVAYFFSRQPFLIGGRKKVKQCYKRQMTSTSVKVIWADFGLIIYVLQT